MRMKIRRLLLFLVVLIAAQAVAWAGAEAIGDGEVPAEEIVLDLPLLVNNDVPLPEGYKPEKLIKLYDHKRNFKLNESNIRVEQVVFEAMNEMFKAAKADKVSGFIVTSGYRTEKQQNNIYKKDKKGVAAKPGHSEHQTGLAFDVTASGNKDFQKTKHYKWLKAHCFEYGFIIRYPKGKEDITQIPFEPWHYRYVGIEHATAMQQMGEDTTLEEYIEALTKPEEEEIAAEAFPSEDAPPEDEWAQQT